MATNSNAEDPVPRRIIAGRRRAGFASGGVSASSSSESLRDSGESGDHDEDEDLHLAVLDRAEQRPYPALAAPPAAPASESDGMLSDEGSDINGGNPDPRQRLDEVAMAGDPAYAREYRLGLMERMLQRNVPLDQIARQFRVSISTAQKDRAELKRRLRQRARELDINEVIGNQTGLYDEISGMALRMASASGTPAAMRLAALRTSLAANADRTRMLASTGVLDALRYRRAETNAELSDVQMLMARTNEMFEALATPVEEAPAAPLRVRRSRPAPAPGFTPFAMDDAEASSGDAETEEL